MIDRAHATSREALGLADRLDAAETALRSMTAHDADGHGDAAAEAAFSASERAGWEAIMRSLAALEFDGGDVVSEPPRSAPGPTGPAGSVGRSRSAREFDGGEFPPGDADPRSAVLGRALAAMRTTPHADVRRLLADPN